MRVKRGSRRTQKRRKVLKQAKGYYGAKSKSYRVAKEAVEKSLAYAYRDRRQRKRQMRSLWIIRINAGARLNGLSYNRLIDGLGKAGCIVNRKILAELAVEDPSGFAALVEAAKQALGESAAAPAAESSEPASAVPDEEPGEAAAESTSDEEE